MGSNKAFMEDFKIVGKGIVENKNFRLKGLLILLSAVALIIILKITSVTGSDFILNKEQIKSAEMGKIDVSNGINLYRDPEADSITDKESIKKVVEILSDIRVKKTKRDDIKRTGAKAYSIILGGEVPQGFIVVLEDGTFIFEDLKVYEKMSDPLALYLVPENLYISKNTYKDKLDELKKLLKFILLQ